MGVRIIKEKHNKVENNREKTKKKKKRGTEIVGNRWLTWHS